MPNGGTDCCGTCWFNAKNKGEAGHGHSGGPEPAYCVIREFSVDNPFHTYCANHPDRLPERDPIPIGPVFRGDGQAREFWQPSPDSEEIRLHLLELLRATADPHLDKHLFGGNLRELAIWQLGEFREERAVEYLRQIAGLDVDGPADQPALAGRSWLADAAAEALGKIAGPVDTR